MISLGLGERKRFTYKSIQPLVQRIISTHNMRYFSRLLVDASVIAAKYLIVNFLRYDCCGLQAAVVVTRLAHYA